MPNYNALKAIRHKLVVSVQAEQHEPLAPPQILSALCESVLLGGAEGLRLADLTVIRLLRERYPHLSIIGLTKPDTLPREPENEVYITPTVEEAFQLAEAGASLIATDATDRARPDGKSLEEWVRAVKQRYPEVGLMADISTLEESISAVKLGFDCVGTTLSGYTAATRLEKTAEPDWSLLKALVERLPKEVPVVLEGRVNSPLQAKRGLDLGAYAVVVGSAITRPHLLTRQYVNALM